MKKIVEAIKKANYVYIIGNGGSASTANHFANDLVKMCDIKAISLCANEAVVMSYANDNGYDSIFIEQLSTFLEDGDLLITISGSGKSPNILNAKWFIKACKYFMDVEVISFPTMKEMKCNMQKAEDKHLQLVHKICTKLSTR
jgi:phosphoheptose isomerase